MRSDIFVQRYYMKWGCGKPIIHIEYSVYFVTAFLLLIIPIRWLLAAVTAAAVHELFHIAAIALMGGVVTDVRIGIGGTIIETQPLNNRTELVAALAGPTGSILLVCMARWIPRIAFCAFVHAIFNLLPFFPLDGGRILHCIIRMIVPEGKGERTAEIVEWILRAAFAVFCLFVGLGLLVPILLVVPLLWRNREKHLAKMGK